MRERRTRDLAEGGAPAHDRLHPPANNLYCSVDNVPRQQMAAFLVRAFAP